VLTEKLTSSGSLQHLRLEPLSIVVHDHQLYVVGRDHQGGLHPHRFSRISSVDVLDDSFQYPGRTEYDPDQVFRDSFGIRDRGSAILPSAT
jgi:hypothetical protein